MAQGNSLIKNFSQACEVLVLSNYADSVKMSDMHPRTSLFDLSRKISLRVLLRITAMDVCCGPPSA